MAASFRLAATFCFCLLSLSSGCKVIQDYIPKMSNPLLDSVKEKPELKVAAPAPEVEYRMASRSYYAEPIEEELAPTCGFYPKSASCDQFFHGPTWPAMRGQKSTELIKLCQNNLDKSGNIGDFLFATLFDTEGRIPVYTANVINIDPDVDNSPRPSSYLWHRVSLTLCSISEIPSKQPIQSVVGQPSKCHDKVDCGTFQAVTDDYTHNPFHCDRGHLSPNSINGQDEEKQVGTFTLTNAAPQFANFNRLSWREFECVAQMAIEDLAPREDVYILTGTYGARHGHDDEELWMNVESSTDGKNPVKIPGYFWKAVCYPGNKDLGKEPWAYGLMEENINYEKIADYKNYINIREFSDKYFTSDIFGPECMDAGFGKFGDHVFSNWKEFLIGRCSSQWDAIAERWPKEEL